METFIAFFDVLGFKEIIYNNDLHVIKGLFDNLLRESQIAVGGNEYKRHNPGVTIPNLNNQKVNCLHISDSIVFWTDSNTEEDFKELVNACSTFYWRSLQMDFPLRGCLTYGEIDFNPHTIKNVNGVKFYNSSLIGKGLVDAYLKSENIEFAGCILDYLAINRVNDKVLNDLINEQIICMYKVPLKKGANYEHVFRPMKGNFDDSSFRNKVFRIKELFTYASKTELDKMTETVKIKMNNTIDFMSYFRESGSDFKKSLS